MWFTIPLLYSHFKTLVLQNLNWIGDHYFEMAVAGGEEKDVEDQQTADAILSINYRDKVGFKDGWMVGLQDGSLILTCRFRKAT